MFSVGSAYAALKARLLPCNIEKEKFERISLFLVSHYLGDYEIEEDSKGNVKKTHYLQGAIYIQTVKADGTTSEQYYSTISDFQGSLIALVDEQGVVKERYAFDPWGARRNPDDWTQTDTRTSWITHRGYTGHEHIDVFGLINMNGRVYDPITAAFFSPDPFVQSAGDWMNYNRYTYCMNNPFRYTDPSGNNPILIAMLIGAAISAASYTASVAMSEGGFNNWNWGQFALSVGIGAVSGAVTADIGSFFGAVGSNGVGWELLRASAHGLSGAGFAVVGGGDPGVGFASGFLGSVGGSAFQAYGGKFAQSVAGTLAFSSLAGGVGAVATGGDFWKGATIGLMVGR